MMTCTGRTAFVGLNPNPNPNPNPDPDPDCDPRLDLDAVWVWPTHGACGWVGGCIWAGVLGRRGSVEWNPIPNPNPKLNLSPNPTPDYLQQHRVAKLLGSSV